MYLLSSCTLLTHSFSPSVLFLLSVTYYLFFTGKTYVAEHDVPTLAFSDMNDNAKSMVVTRIPIDELPGTVLSLSLCVCVRVCVNVCMRVCARLCT